MRLETKAQIAKATLNLLTWTTWLFLLGVLILVLCVGLQINPFRETTSSLLAAAFGGLIGIAAVLVLLNVATNISIIADTKITELRINTSGGGFNKLVTAFIAAAIVVVGLVFLGTYLSKERYLAVVHQQADEVLNDNKSLLDEISQLLASGKPEDFRRIDEISSFLKNQRAGLPELTVIYPGKFEGKLAIYSINQGYRWQPKETIYTPSYFRCTKNLDCDYLGMFFAGENVEIMRKYTFRDDRFYIYIPFIGKESRFVLQFDSMNRYGKLGS